MWQPAVGITSGVCVSIRAHNRLSVLAQELRQPIESTLPLSGSGLTGDRCFSLSDCRDGRNCLGRGDPGGENVTVCRASRRPCVCMPAELMECSSTSGCDSSDEICASIFFQKQSIFSYWLGNDSEIMRLSPICMSPSIPKLGRVVPVSSLSLIDNLLEFRIASIQHPVPFDPTAIQTSLNMTLDKPPFSVPPLSQFNSFTTNELANDFIGGILSLLVVALLRRIFRGLIYFFSGIHHNGYSAFIIFSRLASFRHILRLFKRREPFGDFSRRQEAQEFGFGVRTILFPIAALAGLYIAELVTIIAGTQVRSEYIAEQNFDPKLSVVGDTQRPRWEDDVRSDCDDFFVPIRGLFEAGKVLKCVSEVPPDRFILLRGAIRLSVFYFSGESRFDIFSANGSAVGIELSTFVVSKSRVFMRTMPLRPDLQSEAELKYFLNVMLNGVRRRLKYDELDVRHTLWRRGEDSGANEVSDGTFFDHFHEFNVSAEMIGKALRAELRDMDLELNSTGKPWVFRRSHTFEQMEPAMAVVRHHRIANAWLLIALVLVSMIQIIVNARATHFDEVAFVAMRELMGEDCLLGPLVTDGVVGKEVDLRKEGGKPSNEGDQ
ncbi:hypothetical protein FGB62_151g01 [Gracilaria domingensis]|nr:hypothetical protein FGB62_151g01 [Gracilaria domingensis]